jgi:hypothetical protein
MKLKIALLAIAISAAGCAMVPTEDKEAYSKIKKVAIVGYTLDYGQDVKSSLGSSLMGGGGSTNSMGGITENRPYESPISKAAYDNMVKALQQMKWTVVGADKVMTSAALREFHAKNMKWGSQPLQPRHERQERIGIPQYHHMNALVGKKNGPLQTIAAELGVDALAFVYVETNITYPVSMGGLGMGSASYYSQVNVDFYNPAKDQLMMRVRATGDEMKQGEGSKPFVTGSTEANTFGGVERAANAVVPQLKKSL